MNAYYTVEEYQWFRLGVNAYDQGYNHGTPTYVACNCSGRGRGGGGGGGVSDGIIIFHAA